MQLPNKGSKDSPWDWRNVAFVLLTIVIISGVSIWAFYPTLALDVREDIVTVNNAGPIDVAADDSEPLFVHQEDVAFLNRIYMERTDEVAYCGLVAANRTVRIWFADTYMTNQSSAQFTFQNCPTEQYPALAMVHTHPRGTPTPSAQDKATLMENQELDYLCIQHGEIHTADGVLANFNCYIESVNSSNALQKIPIRLID